MRAKESRPSASDFGQMRALLAKRGFSQQQIDDAIGSKINNRTFEEIGNSLILWLSLGGDVVNFSSGLSIKDMVYLDDKYSPVVNTPIGEYYLSSNVVWNKIIKPGLKLLI